MTDTSAYLVIFSDDERTGASNQSYLGKVMVVVWVCYIEWKILRMGMKGSFICIHLYMKYITICEKINLICSSSSFHRTSPTCSSSTWAPRPSPQQETSCISKFVAPRTLPVLPAGSPLRWLWGDRLVRLDHLSPRIQRLPLQRILPVPPGGKPQSDQPRYGSLHHACAQALKRRSGSTMLCSW